MKRFSYFLTFLVFAFIVLFQSVSCAARTVKKFDQSPVIETTSRKRGERSKSVTKAASLPSATVADSDLFEEALQGLPKNDDIKTATAEELHHGPPGLGYAVVKEKRWTYWTKKIWWLFVPPCYICSG